MKDIPLAEVPVWDQFADQKDIQIIKSGFVGSGIHSRRALVPEEAKKLLGNEAVPSQNMHFWWRAQGIAFMVRPNERTRLEIQSRKQQQSWSGIPDGTVSVHIRHGDKGTEMQLVPDVEYLFKAEELVRHDESLRKSIFLSTEDADSIQFFKNLDDWTVLTIDVPRPDQSISPIAFAKRIGSDEEMLNSLVNLDLALQCSGWVGTIKSNWNRVIEELRSTVRCKAHRPYIDAHSGWTIDEYDW